MRSTPTCRGADERLSTCRGRCSPSFEKELAAYNGAKYAIGVGNGTDALWLTFMAMGLGAGDEVITHANTFFATVEAIWIAGCTAVLVDCDRRRPDASTRPRSARPSPAGHGRSSRSTCTASAPRCDEIRAIADEHGLLIIEDNAQGIDAARRRLQDRRALGRGLHSFIIQKNLGTFGDGGAIWTNHAFVDDDGAAAAQPRLEYARRTQSRLQQPPRRSARRRPVAPSSSTSMSGATAAS